MLINDLISLVLDIPPILAAQWGVWFAFGLMLSIWGRRERTRLVVHAHDVRQSSGVHHLSGVRPIRTAARPVQAPEPAPAGDAFGELEAMLNAQDSSHRSPGDALTLPDVVQ